MKTYGTTSCEGSMRVLELRAENIKRLRAVRVVPDPNDPIVLVSGRNGMGKSSLIESIWYALAGESAVPEEPIRKGEQQAEVRLDLGAYVVTRRWTRHDGETRSTISVASPDGARFPSPQKLLDQMLGDLSFDPVAFLAMSPRQQRDVMLGAGARSDYDRLDREKQAALAERLAAKRDQEHRDRAVDEAKRVLPDAAGIPEEPISALDLSNRLKILRQQEAGNAQETNSLALARAELCRLGGALAKTHSAVLAAEAAAQRLRDEEHEARIAMSLAAETERRQTDRCAALVEPDIAGAEKELREIETLNDKVRRLQRLREQQAEHERSIQRLIEADKALAAKNQQIDALFSAMTVDVPELGISDSGLQYGGLPLQQASGAEQIRIAVAIAMALNPKIRVLCIRQGSALDTASMEALRALAVQHGYQVWIEKVDESGMVGIVIEDGEVRAAIPERETERDSQAEWR